MKCTLIIFINLIIFTNCVKLTTINTIPDLKYQINVNFTLPEGPIYAKGWLKYTTFEKVDTTRPKEFYKNSGFYEQMKNGETIDLTKKDKVGYINIPEDDSFFFILTENNLNVLSSRKSNLARTIDILNIYEIVNNTNPNQFEGGVTDHGDFLEGYCFQLRTCNLKNKHLTWELCAETREQKLMWMNTIVKLIRTMNISEINKLKRSLSLASKSSYSNSTIERTKVTWVPITMWSECSKPCGGGKSYMERLCILPSDSKEKCEGERILTKDCNLEPCSGDHMNIALNFTSNSNSTFRAPIMKYLPVSRRPLRYEKCILKEGDLAIYIDQGSVKGVKIPVRVILNNKTLTAYSNDDYESIVVSHRLSTVTGLRKYEGDRSNTCFEIEESKKKTIFCAFVSNSKNLADLAKEWQMDILDFIKKCANYYSHELDYKDMNDFSVSQVQNTLDFYQDKEKEDTEKIIVKTQQLALQAIEKELKVENLIEKEEDEKQKKLELEINNEFEKIKKQKETINQALIQKKKQADLYANKLLIKKKIKTISEQVKREVMKIREDLRARILSKQKDQKRKRELIMNQISTLKKDISKDLLKASKNGNNDECNPERPAKEIIEYCGINYESDYSKMNECVKNDNFCYMCCESEFGDLHLESRSNCYTKCDDYYIYKIKFGKITKKLKLNIDVTPIGIKSTECVGVECSKNKKKIPALKNPPFIPFKFIEKKMEIFTNPISTTSPKVPNISKLIEEEKKRELLLDIQQDLDLNL